MYSLHYLTDIFSLYNNERNDHIFKKTRFQIPNSANTSLIIFILYTFHLIFNELFYGIDTLGAQMPYP